MSIASSYGISKLFLSLPVYQILFGVENNSIYEINVDSPILSASFYREYLGFKLIKIGLLKSNGIVINKGKNYIRFISKNISNNTEIETVKSCTFIFKSSEIDVEYNKVKGKVRVVTPLNSTDDGKKSFEINDCNGMKIVYTSTLC